MLRQSEDASLTAPSQMEERQVARTTRRGSAKKAKDDDEAHDNEAGPELLMHFWPMMIVRQCPSTSCAVECSNPTGSGGPLATSSSEKSSSAAAQGEAEEEEMPEDNALAL